MNLRADVSGLGWGQRVWCGTRLHVVV